MEKTQNVDMPVTDSKTNGLLLILKQKFSRSSAGF